MSDLHYDLIKRYKNYSIKSLGQKIADTYHYMFDVIVKDNIIMSGIHIAMGSYDRNKNIFVWSNLSETLDRNIIKDIEKIRSNIKNTKIDEDISVLSTQDLLKELRNVSSALDIDILIDRSIESNMTNVYIIKNIFSDNRH